ncbi:MAG: hypothetical protein QOI80_3263 [Solirubrobacteraceae bacterium]|nr:hypothetical protein [Solirubrobacteraceae bacterium]
MRLRRVTLLVCALVALAVAAPAGAVPLHSDNVTLVTKLPEAVGAASARFSADGNTMYVSTWKGLHVYDITQPADPQRLGFLPLPHFENEDVDAGDGVVIITNDPSEGVGLVYVIDVSDPHLPTVRSVIQNGDIVGSSSQSNTGHIANCIQGCKYLWTTGTEEGVVIYDLADLDNPKFVKKLEMPRGFDSSGELKENPGFTHDVFVDKSGIAWVTGQDGTFGYSTTDPTDPKLVYRSDEAVFNSGNDGPSSPETAQDYPLDFLHHNSIRTGIQLAPTGGPTPTLPEPSLGAPPKRPSRAALKRALKRCGKRRTCRAAAARRYEARRARYRHLLAAYRAKQQRAQRTTLGGLGDVMAITEEDYTRPTCQGQGSLETWQITPGQFNSDGSTKLKLLDTWTTELDGLQTGVGRSPATVMCSAHWFDEDRGLLAQGWYDQGVRFLDVSDPTNIRQVGYWVTTGMFWAAYYAPSDPSRQTVYGLDVTGGIDVLHIDRSTMATRVAPIPKRWMSGVSFRGPKPSPTFGFACPLLLSTAV